MNQSTSAIIQLVIRKTSSVQEGLIWVPDRTSRGCTWGGWSTWSRIVGRWSGRRTRRRGAAVSTSPPPAARPPGLPPSQSSSPSLPPPPPVPTSSLSTPKRRSPDPSEETATLLDDSMGTGNGGPSKPFGDSASNRPDTRCATMLASSSLHLSRKTNTSHWHQPTSSIFFSQKISTAHQHQLAEHDENYTRLHAFLAVQSWISSPDRG